VMFSLFVVVFCFIRLIHVVLQATVPSSIVLGDGTTQKRWVTQWDA
jgi:hypothetical protein